METKIIAEIGINHNGQVDLCNDLISIAGTSGCNYESSQL